MKSAILGHCHHTAFGLPMGELSGKRRLYLPSHFFDNSTENPICYGPMLNIAQVLEVQEKHLLACQPADVPNLILQTRHMKGGPRVPDLKDFFRDLFNVQPATLVAVQFWKTFDRFVVNRTATETDAIPPLVLPAREDYTEEALPFLRQNRCTPFTPFEAVLQFIDTIENDETVKAASSFASAQIRNLRSQKVSAFQPKSGTG